jgi:hypothetical protein
MSSLLFHYVTSVSSTSSIEYSLSTLRNLPIWLRKRFAKLYGLGGFHSGCAFSYFLWYNLYSGMVIGAHMNGQQDKTHSVRLSIAILIWVIFVVIIGLALPTFRERMQDYFELVH